MPIDLYGKEFQNWLKGVLGLNATRTALCKCMFAKFEKFVEDIHPYELTQFFCCLKSNQITRLKPQRYVFNRWECKHDSCKDLMDHFVDNHTEKSSLRYKWKHGSIDTSNVGDEDKSSIWNAIVLYMHIDRKDAAEDYSSIECLNISHVIKIMRNFKVLFPDGSAEPYEEVIKGRNKLMHSPNNIMYEEETQNILQWAQKLLDCLEISGETYYQDTIQYLNDLAENDFVINYQSEENKKILAEVLEAKGIADNLCKVIRDENIHCKIQSKELLEKLEWIGCSRTLEMKATEYKSIVKVSLEEKQETIGLDKAEYDEESEHYKELEKLEQKTKQEIQEVEEDMQKSEPEEMAEIICSLYKEKEILKNEKKQAEVEASYINDLEIWSKFY